VTGSEGLFGPAVSIGHQIKDAIRNEVRLVASVGVAPNKFLAKIASDLDKPDGFVVVDPERVQEFLDPLPITRLWGVGKQGSKVFQRLGIRTIAELRRLPVEVLQDRFGSHGEHLWKLARGIDDRRVIPDRDAKSISHETTFATDIDDAEVLRSWLLELTEQVARRLRRHELRGRTVQIKVPATTQCGSWTAQPTCWTTPTASGTNRSATSRWGLERFGSTTGSRLR